MRKKVVLVCVGLLVAACACWRMIKNTESKPPYTQEGVIDKAVIAATQRYYGMKLILSKTILDRGTLRPGVSIVGSTVQFCQIGRQDPVTIQVWYCPSGYDVSGPFPSYKPTKCFGYWYYPTSDNFHMIR